MMENYEKNYLIQKSFFPHSFTYFIANGTIHYNVIQCNYYLWEGWSFFWIWLPATFNQPLDAWVTIIRNSWSCMKVTDCISEIFQSFIFSKWLFFRQNFPQNYSKTDRRPQK